MKQTAEGGAPLLLMPVEDQRCARRAASARHRFSRWLTRAMVAVLIAVGVFATGGIGASATPPANAFINLCSNIDNMSARNYSWPAGGAGIGLGGIVGAGLNAISNATTSSGNQYTQGMYTEYDDYAKVTAPDGTVKTVGAVTAYEWFGTAGLEWRGFNVAELEPAADCGWTALGWQALTGISNLLWQLVLVVGNIIFLLYTLAAQPAIMNTLMKPLGLLLEEMGQNLFLPFLIPVVILAALWVAWTGLIKSRGTEAIQGIVWVLAAAISATVFLFNPIWFVERLNGAVGIVQSAVLQVVAGAGTTAGVTSANEDSLCYAGTPGNMLNAASIATGTPPPGAAGLSGAAQDARNIQTRQMQCLVWQMFFFIPWKEGQFGALADVEIPESVLPAVTINNRQIADGNTVALKYLNAVVTNHDEVVNDASGGRGVVADWPAKQEQVKTLITWMKDEYTQPVQSRRMDRTDPGFAGVWNFVGANGSNQISLAFLAIVAILFGGVPIIFLSTKLLFYELMTVVMLLLAPLYLTIGIHPGFGRRVALGWLEYVLNLSIKRIAVMFLLAVLLLVIQIVMVA